MQRFKSFVCFFLLIASFAVRGEHYNVKNFSTKNGLTNTNVLQTVQDKQGFIWLATQGGLSRFDGKKFSSYYNTDGLITNDLSCMLVDSKQNLWIGTAKGLCKFDGVKFTSYIGHGLNNTIYSIIEDESHQIWIATYGGGLVCFDGKTFTQYTKKDGLPTDTLFSVMQDHQGSLWIGTYHYGVCKVEKGNFKTSILNCKIYTKKEGISSNNIFCLLESEPGKIWLGSTNGAISIIYNGIIQPFFISEETKTDQINALLKDKRQNIWIATSEHGLIKFSDNKFTFFNEKNGLASHVIFSVFQDGEGNIWAGSDFGVSFFRNEAFINMVESDGLPSKLVHCFVETQKKSILCGTAAGLCEYENGKLRTITSIAELVNSSIHSIVIDADGNYWIGTQNGLFICSYNRELKLIKKISESEGNFLTNISAILKCKSSKMVVATYGNGLYIFDKSGIKHYGIKEGLSSNIIHTIFEDKNENIWLATLQGGAIKFDGKTFTSITKKDGLADNTVYSINQDNRGYLLFATSEGGLSCYDGKMFHNFNEASGISSNLVSTIQVDRFNYYWLGTSKGLNKIKLTEYFDIDFSKFYSDQNGLEGSEFGNNSLYIDNEGIIWAGTTEGLTRFNTELDYPNVTPPNLVLHEIHLAYQKVDWKKYSDNVDPKTGLPIDLQLNYKNNHLTFEFQALTTDNNVKYRYMLEGLENRWSPSTTSTEAIYANIPSGRDYIFRVQAVNSDGVWSTNNIEYHFTIQSPVWQRWWFRILAIIGSVTSLIVFINFRTKRLAQEKKILEEKVEVRTGELKETNSKLNVAFTDIKDSINYAQRIQQAILPVESKIKELLPDSFILFKPRDVVSGDFYWFGTVEKNKETYHIIAAADCTGHGVPGAFMSMIGNTILNEIVITKEIINPSDILSQLHTGVRKALKQNQNTSRDGMDICLCCINMRTLQVTYAGAFNPLWILRKDKSVEVIKATKTSIGGFTSDAQFFESHAVQLSKGESIYLFTDGYADQFGGENGKKLTTKKFRDALVELHDKSMEEQGFYLNNFIEIWRGKEFQVDDILVIGIRL